MRKDAKLRTMPEEVASIGYYNQCYTNYCNNFAQSTKTLAY